MLNIVNKKGLSLIDYVEKKPLIIDPNSSLLSVIKKLSNFVGESIPIVNKKTNSMVGIISENDVLKAYLDISEEINQTCVTRARVARTRRWRMGQAPPFRMRIRIGCVSGRRKN